MAWQTGFLSLDTAWLDAALDALGKGAPPEVCVGGWLSAVPEGDHADVVQAARLVLAAGLVNPGQVAGDIIRDLEPLPDLAPDAALAALRTILRRHLRGVRLLVDVGTDAALEGAMLPPEGDARLPLVLDPEDDFAAAQWLSFLNAPTRGHYLRCEWCRQVFIARRAGARFHDPDCRAAAAYAAKTGKPRPGD
jgi:hypothetical protein